ncbi:MAG: hypothetical protein V5804_00695 [Mucilaginibacter sp.]|uniref:hypothetical protein n=1 Tax=Mucilaginibacter sp. TaxID=1882438 RepID=UPI0034E45FBC
MSNQNQSNQYQKPDENGADKKPSVYNEQHGIGENDENHTSGGYIHYDDVEDGESSQNSTAGQDGEDVHTNNEGGTSSGSE